MSLYSTDQARPFGDGQQSPAGSIVDPVVAGMVSGYKRTVASRYRAVRPDELELALPPGALWVSPKIDGHLWFLVFDQGEAILVNPRGRVISGNVPLLKEAQSVASRVTTRTIFAGELFALRKGGRPRSGDVSAAMGGNADAMVARLGFMAFDVLLGGDAQTTLPVESYEPKLELMQRVFKGGKRVQCVRTERVMGHAEVSRLYGEWAEGGKGEGLVARSLDGRTYKIKPTISIDAVVVGFTERGDNPGHVRSMLLALVREDGQFQIIGSLGNLGTDDVRKELFDKLDGTDVESTYRQASSDGALYRFVEPKLVVETLITDVQSEDFRGDPAQRMVLTFEDGAWKATRKMPGVIILFPRLERIRDDKVANEVDCRIAQVLERCEVAALDQHVETVDLPKSEVVRREVWTKAYRGNTNIQKLLVWKTNKHEVDERYPAFVIHWTNYSPSRKDPLQRDVRLAASEVAANVIADEMIEKNIKKGWDPVE
ncbi:MAG: hypothetical protein EP330_19385 [Deltaproteobacteria bacterium]|nr:MAG: hypothetical protein EP330_19385 [Deltaproteobacteria bacterium]